MSEHQAEHHPTDDEMRRGFLVKFAAAVVGGIVGLIPAFLGGGFFMTPIVSRKKNHSVETDGFLKLATTDGLVPGGPPRIFQVTGIKHDAWTTYAEAALGSVYLRLTEGNELIAFNAKCPHLGCTVSYQSSADAFVCPCHRSSFDIDGSRNNEIPPRNMDRLEAEIRNDDEVWVKFVNFRAGTSEKVAVS